MSAIPSTKALRAFETVARLGSITAAASELGLSQSALSRRIQALEEELGQPLFSRSATGLALTEAGRHYASRLQTIFQSLDDATRSVRDSAPAALRVMVPSVFNALLMRGWGGFTRANPELRVDVLSYPGIAGSDPRLEQTDIAIYFGEREWEGWDCTYLTPNSYVMAVCAPALLANGMLEDARELENHTWITSIYAPEGWQWWCAAAGHPGLRPKKTFEVSSAVMGIPRPPSKAWGCGWRPATRASGAIRPHPAARWCWPIPSMLSRINVAITWRAGRTVPMLPRLNCFATGY